MRITMAAILSLTILTAQPMQMVPHNSQQHTLEEETTTLFDRCTPLLAAGLFGACLLLTAPQKVLKSLQTQLSPKNLACNFIKEYCSWALTTLAHEAGHAFVAKYILKKPYTIHLGSNTPQKALFSINNIHIDGISHLEGYTEIAKASSEQTINFVNSYCRNHSLNRSTLNTNQIEKIFQSKDFRDFQNSLLPNKKKYALFLLAGGITALAWHKGTKACASIIKNTKSGSKITLSKLFKQIFVLDGITLHQIFNTLIPCSKSCDSGILLRDCLGLSPRFIERITMFTQFMPLVAECILALTDQRATPNTPFHSRLFIGAINYCLRGYFRFHA